MYKWETWKSWKSHLWNGAIRKSSESEWVSWCRTCLENIWKQCLSLCIPVPSRTTSSLRAFRRSIKAHDTPRRTASARLFLDLWPFLTSWSKANLKENQHNQYCTLDNTKTQNKFQLLIFTADFLKGFQLLCIAMSSAVQVAMVHWALSSVA